MIKMKYFKVSDFKINQPIICKILKLIDGKYGPQFIVDIPGEGEVYLTNAKDLMISLKKRSIGDCVEIILLTRGQQYVVKSIFKVTQISCKIFENEKEFYKLRNKREYRWLIY